MPAVFEQLSVTVCVPAVAMVTDCDPPLVAFEPDQAPLAVQLVGLLVVLHVTVVAPPAVKLLGDTCIVTVGLTITGACSVTVTVAVLLFDPAEFVQVSLYDFVPTADNTPVFCDPPPTDFAPDQASLAVQLVGLFLVVQLNRALAPFVTEPGLVVNVT